MPWIRSLPASIKANAISLTRPVHFYPHFEKREIVMPENDVIERAHRDAEEGKSPSTQAGEFVREEIEHVREGKHGARSPKQAIAIGLSKARRAGINVPPPKKSSSSQKVRRQAQRDLSKGRSGSRKTSASRSRATSNALRRESKSSVSHAALLRQAKGSARKRGPAARHRAATSAVRTKRRAGRRTAGAKARRR